MSRIVVFGFLAVFCVASPATAELARAIAKTPVIPTLNRSGHGPEPKAFAHQQLPIVACKVRSADVPRIAPPRRSDVASPQFGVATLREYGSPVAHRTMADFVTELDRNPGGMYRAIVS